MLSLLVLYPCYPLLCLVLRSPFLLSIVSLPTLCILPVGSTVSVDISIRRLTILKTFSVLILLEILELVVSLAVTSNM